MDGENLTVLIAFAAGVLSFASPCVLPLVPAYIGHMMAVSAQPPGPPRPVVSLGRARFLRELGGAVLIFMGLHLLGVINIGLLNREYTVDAGWKGNAGYPRSLAMGMSFAAGWTPCIGPAPGRLTG